MGACNPDRETFVVDAHFGLVGRLDGVHVDPDGEAWATVHCGTFGARTRLAPLRGARWWSGYLLLAHSRQHVRAAPDLAPPGILLDAYDAQALREHYAVHEDDPAPRYFRPDA